MLEKIGFLGSDTPVSHPVSHNVGAARKSLVMVKNDRTAGFIPKWEPAANSALLGLQGTDNDFNAALAEQNGGAGEEFGFADLLDMVNPLQHLPVVSFVYREVTGDEIKPISQIIGGAAFGGAIGAASGIVNTIAEAETGKDLAGNAMALAMNEPAFQRKVSSPVFVSNDDPQTRLAEALLAAPAGISNLPGTTLAFADLRAEQKPERIPTYNA